MYGEAAEEFGKSVSEAKKRGESVELPNGIEYEIGQSRGIKRKTLADIREATEQKRLKSEGGSGSGSGTRSGSDAGEPASNTVNGTGTSLTQSL